MLVIAAALALGSVLPGAPAVQAQGQAAVVAEREGSADKDKEQPGPIAKPDAPPGSAPAWRVKRWVDWQAGTVESRYRWIETTTDEETSNSLQHKQSFKAGFKFDSGGRYSLQALAGTGRSFSSSWDNLGPGIGEPAWTFNLRQLYLQARPADWIEGAWGGMAIARGENTEITSFDNDNYLMAGRLSLKRPAQLYVDELSVTAGFLGDLNTPNVFGRFDRWDEHNYTQVLAAKAFGKHVSVSADWTDLDDISTLRQAVRVSTKQWLPVDALRFENYQRVEGDEAWGYAISADKRLHPRVSVTGGFADIDENVGTLTGDRYASGKRLFIEPKLAVLPELTVSLFYGEGIANDFPLANEHRFDVVVQYNVLKALQQHGAW